MPSNFLSMVSTFLDNLESRSSHWVQRSQQISLAANRVLFPDVDEFNTEDPAPEDDHRSTLFGISPRARPMEAIAGHSEMAS
jgi:hypothetical protein